MVLTLSHGGKVLFSLVVCEPEPAGKEPPTMRYDPRSVTDCRAELASDPEREFGFVSARLP